MNALRYVDIPMQMRQKGPHSPHLPLLKSSLAFNRNPATRFPAKR